MWTKLVQPTRFKEIKMSCYFKRRSNSLNSYKQSLALIINKNAKSRKGRIIKRKHRDVQ
jgi:hypothetical protein